MGEDYYTPVSQDEIVLFLVENFQRGVTDKFAPIQILIRLDQFLGKSRSMFGKPQSLLSYGLSC